MSVLDRPPRRPALSENIPPGNRSPSRPNTAQTTPHHSPSFVPIVMSKFRNDLPQNSLVQLCFSFHEKLSMFEWYNFESEDEALPVGT